MKKTFISVICVILFILLQSCQMTSLDTDILLTPPQMNEVNLEIQRCIEKTVGGAYELIYPKSGGYQTAITSVDLNGDGKSESLCFYTSGTEGKIGLMVLEQISDVWTAIGMTESQATAVDRVAFTDIDGDGTMEIVVGWQYLSGEELALEIFKFGEETDMESVHTGVYINFLVFDDSVVILSRNTGGKTASATLIGKSGKNISILNTVSLNTSITGLISVQSEVVDNVKSIYIDEQLESLMYATEVIKISERGELTVTSAAISNQTMRTRAYVCTDINGDGSLDIPVERKLPEYKRGDTTENLVYVDWHTYKSGALEYITSAYTSANEQFFIELPDSWIGHITIQRDPETDRAIHFYHVENKTDIPMFSIRVFSQQEFSETMQKLGWEAITTANENVYTFKPDTSKLDKEFEVDLERITKMFHLIP